MPTFKYVAKNNKAKTVRGKITEKSQNLAIKELRKDDLTIISCEEVKPSVKSEEMRFGQKKVKSEDVVIFTRQLSTMVDSGVTVVEALSVLCNQMEHPTFKIALTKITWNIQNGRSLSFSFSRHPKIFSSIYVNLIKVAEETGSLNAILERISGYIEKTAKIKRKFKAALMYPMVIVSIAILVVSILMIKVVPLFVGMYAGSDQELPGITQFLISVSNFLRTNILWIIGGIIGLVFGVRKAHKTRKGARILDGMLLNMPVFGDLVRKVLISRFSRTLATLFESGVSILVSLDIVRRTIGNTVLEDVIRDVKSNVYQGLSVAGPLRKSTVFPPMVSSMISIGEKSGQMEKMLSKIAEFYDDQVDASIDGITSIIEPLIIGVLGVVIGFIAVALFLPIMNMAELV